MRRVLPSLASAASAAAILSLAAAPVGAQGVTWSLEPTVAYVGWDDDLGLSDGWLWGGGLGLGFGDLVHLEPFYLQRTGLEADSGSIEGDPLPDADPLEFDVHHVGASLELALSRGDVVPFVRITGGALRFDPNDDVRDDVTRLTLGYGGGLRFGLGRAGIDLWGERLDFRLDRSHLYAPATASAEDGERTWHSVVGGASVSIPLGGPAEPAPPGSLVGAAAPVELFAGRLDFDPAFGLDDRNLAALSLGFDLNRLAGIRGFYGWGLNDDWDGTEGLRAWGGEARFRLGSQGLAPFLIAGAGRLDFDEAEEGEPAAPADRTALILGAGLSFSLSDRVGLTVTARDWLMNPSAEGVATDDPDKLVSNWMYSAGLSYLIGGSERRERVEPVRTRTAPALRAPLVEEIVVVRDPEDATVVFADTIVRDAPRSFVLPVLEEGTIYIRFGPGGILTQGEGVAAVSPDALRDLLREELEQAGDTITGADLGRLEERIVARLQERFGGAPAPARGGLSPEVLDALDAMEQRLSRRIDALVEERLEDVRSPDVVVGVAEGDRETTALDRLQRWQSDATLPYGGVGFGEDLQVVLGTRFDFGPLTPGHPLRLVPELAVGIGEGTPSVLLMGNVQYELGGTRGARDFQPYLTAGAGVFTPTILALQTGAGVSFDLRGGRDAPLRGFAELQGLNLFDRTRLLAGVTLVR